VLAAVTFAFPRLVSAALLVEVCAMATLLLIPGTPPGFTVARANEDAAVRRCQQETIAGLETTGARPFSIIGFLDDNECSGHHSRRPHPRRKDQHWHRTDVLTTAGPDEPARHLPARVFDCMHARHPGGGLAGLLREGDGEDPRDRSAPELVIFRVFRQIHRGACWSG
jgi:hypothetical protein